MAQAYTRFDNDADQYDEYDEYGAVEVQRELFDEGVGKNEREGRIKTRSAKKMTAKKRR